MSASFKRGARRVLLTLPTGGGKTSIFGSMLAGVKVRGLVLVHRRELAAQAARRLTEFGVSYGLIMAGEHAKPYERVQIASVATLARRDKLPDAKLVIADEAHLSTADTWAKILDAYPTAWILGLTATPWRMSGKPLLGAYDDLIVAATPKQLRTAGFLCDYVGFSYLAPDVSKIATSHGEYNERQSAEAMRQPQIVANVVEQWKAHASHLSTIVFAVTVEHSQQLTAEFRAAGVRAEHLDGKTPKLQRDAILQRVETGETQVLCNVGVAVEGLDIPRLKCCVDACPTKSLTRAIQKWGRVRRPWNGVTARIHDHAFNIRLHGLPDADRDYSLVAKPEALPPLTRCKQCFASYEGDQCPSCGASKPETIAPGPREIATIPDAEQVQFSSADAALAAEFEGLETPPISNPIEVRWETPGRVIEGRLERAWVVRERFGPRKFYTVKVPGKRGYTFPGTAKLDQQMARVLLGQLIRVTYHGDEPAGVPGTERMRKNITVEVDADA